MQDPFAEADHEVSMQQESSVIHPRVAGRFARRHDGKPILRRTLPPTGIPGRLRLLRDVCPRTRGPFPDLRRMTMSFETNDALYEPFSIPVDNRHQIEGIRRASLTGAPTTFR